MTTPARTYPTFPKTVGPKWVKKILPWVEEFWKQKKRYPSDSELVQRFGFSQEQLLLMHTSKYYEVCLARRGIVRSASEDLSEIQVAAVALLTNFMDKRTSEAKMASIGVTPEMYQGWMNYPPFQRRITQAVDEVTDHFYPEAQMHLTKMIQEGNFSALKFYYEITGRAQSPETINLKVMIVRLQEIIMKHVQDPEVLRAIAMEMQGVVQGGGLHNELQSKET